MYMTKRASKTVKVPILSKNFTYLSIVLLEVLLEEPCTAISKTAFCPARGNKHFSM